MPNSPLIENLKEWVSLYADDLYRWALHKTKDKEVSEDIVQDTFLAAYKSIDKFEGKSQPKTWLFSIINNKIADFHRKKFRQIVINQSSIQRESDEADAFDNLFDKNGSWKPGSSPLNWMDNDEHLLDNLQFKEVLQHCMSNLPEKWFSAIHFKYLESKDGKEICQELGITTSNYWKMLQRAKLQLKICIENNWSK